MSIIDKIRSLFGLGASPTADDDATVRVEHDPARDDTDDSDVRPDATTEAAVKGVDEDGATDGSTAATDVDDDPATDDAADHDGSVADTRDAPTATDDDPADPADEDTSDGDLQSIEGIGPAYAQRLGEAGVETVADLADADPDDLAEATDIAASRVERWVERARE